MTDLSQTIIAKSDQLNADDLIGREIIIDITKVLLADNKQQPTIIHYIDDNGRPYKPCLSMRRVLGGAWGLNGAKYVGRKIKLFRDPNAIFQGKKVGGTRIKELSDISQPMTFSITVSRGKKEDYTVYPLTESEDSLKDLKRMGEIQANKGTEPLKTWWSGLGAERQNKLGAGWLADMKKIANAAQGANNELPVDPISDKADEVSDQITNHQQEG